MNKSDLEKMQKCQEEYNKFFEDTPFQREIDKIAKDIRERQDNAMAMEFTQKIGKMLRENGVMPHITEYKTEMECTENSVKQRYGVEFDSLDFTEHDKKFMNEIKKLKENIKQLDDEITRKNRVIWDADEEVVYLKKQLYGEKYNHKNHMTKVEELQNKITELESELSVKENLPKIKNGMYGEKKRIYIIGLREFGGEQYMRYSDVEDLINELEET